MLSYPVEFTADDNDTVMVTSPDFPELTTYGADRDDALYHAIDAFEEVLAGRMAYREDIPTPSKGKYRVLLATQVALKVALYQAMRESRLRKVDLARRLGWHGKQVDRLLDLDHATRPARPGLRPSPDIGGRGAPRHRGW